MLISIYNGRNAMNRVYECIDKLIAYAKSNLNLHSRNEDYVRNGIFSLFGLDSYAEKSQALVDASTPEGLLGELVSVCVEEGLFEIDQAEYYCDQIMGLLSLSPKEIEDEFYRLGQEKGSKCATEWFYNYSVQCDYVKKAKLDQNPRFTSGGLIVTINKAKPEFRDPKKAASGNSTKGGYPKCSICHENEGFAERSKRTLRTVDLYLDGQKWFWQFSPYGYFYQHGIAVNYEHTPMHVDKATFKRLMDFVDIFPHWFIGCNAPLPRIGGSVLAHDHYQGGGEVLPMHQAKAAYTLKNKSYPKAIVEIPDWQGTVIRIVSKDKDSVVEISEQIRAKWVSYTNEELGIICEDADGVHSAVSPTVVKTDRGYEMSIILRNNVTSEEYPDGVFHAHPEFHVIKKESIGLIEAQGLFILPGRLEEQFNELQKIICAQQPLPSKYAEFEMVYTEIKALCKDDYSPDNVSLAIQTELGNICSRILENTAVFKDKHLTVTFMKELGFAL
ncbi:MAG: galactose-1-phosphate uridylyltransferase [Clostridia bacterium]|nr:galactose-1-phosphate uridylyltransferase [Clostridia bacterium]